jgi:tRNA pseudouridine38-40 synthase
VEPPSIARFKLTVHYDGSAFHGWQRQPDRRTVQGELEEALSRLADRPCDVVGSGRTDTGVHATGQVLAADMPAGWTPERLHRSLNAILPDELWVERVESAADDFHPRYDATARTYTYEVGLRPEAASPFHRRWCWPLEGELDFELLAEAGDAIVGEHSFKAFSKAGQPERGERCRVARAEWTPSALGVRLTITADRYLHHMVRYLVGTMVDVARRRRPLSDVAALLAGEEDLTTSPPAPAQGLFLTRVEYADDAPARSRPASPPSRSPARA